MFYYNMAYKCAIHSHLNGLEESKEKEKCVCVGGEAMNKE